MTNCRTDNCPLESIEGEQECILHVSQSSKSNDKIREALSTYTKHGIKLIENANFHKADFSGLELESKKFKNCDLREANFFGARLIKVGFDFCDLDHVDFQDIIMERVDLRRIKSGKWMHLHHAIFQNVQMPPVNKIGRTCLYEKGEEANIEKALDVYQTLKKSYKSQGNSRAAGHFFEQEMNMRRQLSTSLERVWITILWLLCGYGERPLRTFRLVICIIAYAGLYSMCELQDQWR